MNAFPPGGPPGTPPLGGTPPPGGSGGGWGPPPGGGPPSYGGPPQGGFPASQPEPKKSKLGLFVGIGCGCLLLLGCIVAGGVWSLVSAMGPGEEVVTTTVTPGQPFTLSYVQDGSQRYEAWMEVDLQHTSSYSLVGPILLSENAAAFGEYQMSETGSSNPVGRSSSKRLSWASTGSSTSGTVALFPIPAKSDGATVTVSGTLSAPPGTTGTIRIFVAKRD